MLSLDHVFISCVSILETTHHLVVAFNLQGVLQIVKLGIEELTLILLLHISLDKHTSHGPKCIYDLLNLAMFACPFTVLMDMFIQQGNTATDSLEFFHSFNPLANNPALIYVQIENSQYPTNHV